MLLPTADTAPPFKFGLKQCWNDTPEMSTLELLMANAAPKFNERLLQSKVVADGTPLMASEAMPLMITVGSEKTPALRLTIDALMF
jgi:hypothetical protein